ncbi:sugar transferase [Isoptericola sp. b441]|uniref:Sugar transferase n=1 Tax=Actinotalea lenta TaxID=3064654 RepID=A0ABT9DC89_9CELL|nr:sugar transferase [Isoptericola sp. b441]MDO8108515.1 sugar transferase [Isoptericola sp. b441]
MAPGSSRAKRAFDLAVAIPAAILTLPLQGVVALAVLARLGRPVLFRQRRPGLHGEPFELVKFRTMLPKPPEADGDDLADAERMTTLGRRLRSTSLDELPTLWNVVRGDMSLVGPRPLLMQYLPRYTPEQARRHEVRPGITGLAQVSGRNALSWEEKFRLDVEYVDHHTLAGDLRILGATVRSVVVRDGIAAEGSPTAHEFRGTTQDRGQA